MASIIDELKAQITAGAITFDQPPTTAERLKQELLNENAGVQATELLQKLVLAVSQAKAIRISSIIRTGGHHAQGRAFDVGNEDVAGNLLPLIATDAKVAALKIDELIFDAAVAGQTDRNKWNYDQGAKHGFDSATLDGHKDHIHFSVKTA